VGNYDAASTGQQARPDTMSAVNRAEVAELGDALDSKSSGALPRAGSIPAFGIPSPFFAALRGISTEQTHIGARS
jgi:hypothetical protein